MNLFQKIFIFPFIFFITVWSANIEDDFPKVIPLNITSEEFYELLGTVADGWNEGNARKAADCFTCLPAGRLKMPFIQSHLINRFI